MGADDELDWGEDEGTVQLDLRKVGPIGRPGENAQPYLIVYAGAAVGRTLRVGEELTIGRSPRAELQLHGEGVSRLHARLRKIDGVVHLEDLGSTNGTLVNGERVTAPRALVDGDQIQVGVNLLLKFSLQNEAQARFQEELYEAALRDPLTKVHNRRAFDDRFETDLSHARRHGEALTLLLFDLDFFKSVNDTYGHIAGDYVLATFAELVQSMVRREDLFARYGGEEFALVLVEASPQGASDLAERIRVLVEQKSFEYEGKPFNLTISLGVDAVNGEEPVTVNDLLQRADDRLLEAKRTGRNRVVG